MHTLTNASEHFINKKEIEEKIHVPLRFRNKILYGLLALFLIFTGLIFTIAFLFLSYPDQTSEFFRYTDNNRPLFAQEGSGDITSVIAGLGLSGGATSGDATLNLNKAFAPTWSSTHTFSSASPIAFSSLIPNISIGNTGTLSITDGSNNLLVLTDSGITGSLNVNALTVGGLGTGIVKSDSSGVLSSSAVGLGTSDVSGILPIANGGSNKNLTLSNGGILWTDTDSFEVLSASGTTGLALVSGGTGTPSWFIPTVGSVLFAGISGILQQDNSNFFFDDVNNRLGIGTTSPLTTLDVRGNSGTLSVASISGQTSFAALVVNNDGVGDLFTASSSGWTRFTINKAGAIGLTSGFGSLSQCLTSNGSALEATWGTCGSGGSGASPFQELAGAIVPLNSTLDFLIGGQSTTSAKFAVLNVANNQTIASVSGNFIVMPDNGWGGQVAVNKTLALAGVDIKDTNSLAVLGAEKITAIADRDFSSDTGNWTDPGVWTIVGGDAKKDSAGSGAITLANSALDSAPVAGKTYQIVFSFTTTASSSGSLTPQFGGKNGVAVGQGTEISNTQTQVITAANTTALSFTPTSNWYGTIDNVSVTEITPSSIALRLESSNGTGTPIEFRTGGSNLENIFIGQNSGKFNTTGSENSFLGYSAGRSNTTGFDNSFLGDSAGYSNTTGWNNSFLGSYAGFSNTTGSDNSFLGYSAGSSNTTGISNSFVGYTAGFSNTTGSYNSFLGDSAGYSNTTGFENSFLGFEAGYSNTTGNYNSFLGTFAGYSNTTGDYNSFLGYAAGFSNTTGRSNSFLGYLAGDTNVGGGLNTILGYNADLGSGHLINATAIGANAYVTQNDSLILGSILGINSATASAKIGIGTTLPRAALDVVGSSTATSSAFIENSTTTAASVGLTIKMGATTPGTTTHPVNFLDLNGEIRGSIAFASTSTIQYNTAGIADFAEYLKKDPNQNIDWGSVLCQNQNSNVESCTSKSSHILGVASETPAFLGGNDLGPGSITVGLTGVVSTLVSNANGNIKSGDFITSSNIQGVGEKATKVGQVVGIALESYNSSTSGKILVRVGPSWYDPQVYLTDTGDLNIADQTATNRLIAGLEIITPKLSTTKINLDEINSLTGSDILLNLSEDGKFIVKNSSGSSAITLDSNGNAFFSGLVIADKIRANQIEGLEIFTNRISALETNTSVLGDSTELALKIKALEEKIDTLSNFSAFQATSASILTSGIKESNPLSAEELNLNNQNAIVLGNLTVGGRTVVNDLGVTGNMNLGVLTIKSLEGEINNIAGDLKLQSQGVGGIDILAGTVKIDKSGNIITKGSIKAQKIEVDTENSSPSVGESEIESGKEFVVVNNTNVTSKSKIFLTPTKLTDKILVITDKKEKESFTVRIKSGSEDLITFDYWIIN